MSVKGWKIAGAGMTVARTPQGVGLSVPAKTSTGQTTFHLSHADANELVTALMDALGVVDGRAAEAQRIAAERDRLRLLAASHYCSGCGSLWFQHEERTWQLLSATAGVCCDNVAMKGQMVPCRSGQDKAGREQPEEGRR